MSRLFTPGWLAILITLFAILSAPGLVADETGPGHRSTDIPLMGDPLMGRTNLVGFPLRGPVSWSDVRVVDGGRVLSLDEADPIHRGVFACSHAPVSPACTMSRVMYQWSGSAWQAYDGLTPGMEGTLTAFDGFLVRAATPGILLVFPPTSSTGPLGTGHRKPKGWFVRVIARSGTLEDAGNLLGRLSTASDEFDMHDLEELSPVGESYLSILFENPGFPDSEWGFTSDFRSPTRHPTGVWRFVVRASQDVRKITLSWEGESAILNSGSLIDLETGQRIHPSPGDSYTYLNGPQDREFIFALAIR